MKRIYVIEDPIYRHDLTIFVGSYRQLEAYCERVFNLRREPGNNNHCGEFFTIYRSDDTFVASMLWLEKWHCAISDYVTLSHECLHAAMSVMQAVGVPVGRKGEEHEALAYYHDYIYGSAMKALCDEWKRCH